MVGEVVGRLRDAVGGEVVGAAAHHAPDLANLRRDERAVGQSADADGQVDVLVDNVDRVVGERQVNIDLREAREEFVHDWYDMEASEDDRRRHRQRPPRDGVLPGGLQFRLVDLFQDALARGYEVQR